MDRCNVNVLHVCRILNHVNLLRLNCQNDIYVNTYISFLISFITCNFPLVKVQ